MPQSVPKSLDFVSSSAGVSPIIPTLDGAWFFELFDSDESTAISRAVNAPEFLEEHKASLDAVGKDTALQALFPSAAPEKLIGLIASVPYMDAVALKSWQHTKLAEKADTALARIYTLQPDFCLKVLTDLRAKVTKIEMKDRAYFELRRRPEWTDKKASEVAGLIGKKYGKVSADWVAKVRQRMEKTDKEFLARQLSPPYDGTAAEAETARLLSSKKEQIRRGVPIEEIPKEGTSHWILKSF